MKMQNRGRYYIVSNLDGIPQPKESIGLVHSSIVFSLPLSPYLFVLAASASREAERWPIVPGRAKPATAAPVGTVRPGGVRGSCVRLAYTRFPEVL